MGEGARDPTVEQGCPECGAARHGGDTCTNDFHQMLAWEVENPTFWEVHHLMVLCYHLQHPSLYSPDALTWATHVLAEFVEHGTTTQEIRKRNRNTLDSSNRKWKVTGTPASYGKYEHPVRWEVTAADVIAGGMDNYCENVKAWARSVLDVLKTSGNLQSK
jgi:hypothetical protein